MRVYPPYHIGAKEFQYARDHRFPHPTFFIDDGYSGVDFANRPGFQKMLAEIEAGNVGTVITKDLSRLGRNSSLTGLYINYRRRSGTGGQKDFHALYERAWTEPNCRTT